MSPQRIQSDELTAAVAAISYLLMSGGTFETESVKTVSQLVNNILVGLAKGALDDIEEADRVVKNAEQLGTLLAQKGVAVASCQSWHKLMRLARLKLSVATDLHELCKI